MEQQKSFLNQTSGKNPIVILAIGNIWKGHFFFIKTRFEVKFKEFHFIENFFYSMLGMSFKMVTKNQSLRDLRVSELKVAFFTSKSTTFLP